FLHTEGGDLRLSSVLDEDIEQGLDRLAAPRRGNGLDRLTLQRAELRPADARDQNVRGPCDREPLVIPASALALHLLTHATPDRGIPQPLDELRRATVMGPRRYERAHVVAPGSVGVQVRHDIETRGPCRLDPGDDLGHPPPHRGSGDLEMPDFNRDLR